MKSVTTYAISVFMTILSLTGCVSTVKQKPEEKNPKLVVLLYDISKSNDEYAILKEEHLKEIFTKIAFNGGGMLYGLLIKADSRKQGIFEYKIPLFDTLKVKGNAYQMKNIRNKNKKIMKPFYTEQTKFVKNAKTALIKSKNEKFTDLKNAMELAKTSLMQNIYNGYDKYLIVISDGINDLPPKDGEDKMKRTHLEDVTVILVRPSRTKFVIGKSLIITGSIQDAIKNL